VSEPRNQHKDTYTILHARHSFCPHGLLQHHSHWVVCQDSPGTSTQRLQSRACRNLGCKGRVKRATRTSQLLLSGSLFNDSRRKEGKGPGSYGSPGAHRVLQDDLSRAVEIKHVKSPVVFSTKEVSITQRILELCLFSLIRLTVDWKKLLWLLHPRDITTAREYILFKVGQNRTYSSLEM
jgi:hypothetical protein